MCGAQVCSSIPLHGSSENPAGQSGQVGLCHGSTHPMLSSLGEQACIKSRVQVNRLCIRIGKAVAVAILMQAIERREWAISECSKWGCLPVCSTARARSSAVSSGSRAASTSGATSVSASTEREEGEETSKYTATMHLMACYVYDAVQDCLKMHLGH